MTQRGIGERGAEKGGSGTARGDDGLGSVTQIKPLDHDSVEVAAAGDLCVELGQRMDLTHGPTVRVGGQQRGRV